MKVIGINGSPHKAGNTWHSLQTVGNRLKENGIDFEIIHIGNKAIHAALLVECVANTKMALVRLKMMI